MILQRHNGRRSIQKSHFICLCHKMLTCEKDMSKGGKLQRQCLLMCLASRPTVIISQSTLIRPTYISALVICVMQVFQIKSMQIIIASLIVRVGNWLKLGVLSARIQYGKRALFVASTAHSIGASATSAK